MTDSFDQFTRWLCPKCGMDGFDSWNKAMFDGIVHDPDNLPNPWVIGDTCQCCGHPSVVSYTTADAAPCAILGPGFNDYSHEDEALKRFEAQPDAGVQLLPSPTRDADWSRGCLAAKGQLQ